MPKFTIPGTKVTEAFTDFKSTSAPSYTSRGGDYLAELYPALNTSQQEARSARDRDRARRHRRQDWRPRHVEGMPIGLFENELTVHSGNR